MGDTSQFGQRVDIAFANVDPSVRAQVTEIGLRSILGQLDECLQHFSPFLGGATSSEVPPFHHAESTDPVCATKNRVLFVLWRNSHAEILGSSHVRGVDIGLFLSTRGHDVDTWAPRSRRLTQHQLDLVKSQAYDAVICVKFCPPELIGNVTASGSLLIWDHLDEPHSVDWLVEQMLQYSVAPHRHMFFTNNRLVKAVIDQGLSTTSTAVVYHHHSNHLNFTRASGYRPVGRIAIKGAEERFGADTNTMVTRLQRFGQEHGIEVMIINHSVEPTELHNLDSATQESAQDPSGQLRYHVGFKGIDVAVIWPETVSQGVTVCRKSLNRLAFWWSHGVPVITFPFQSYSDWLVELGYPLVARTEDDVIALLELLVRDAELRETAQDIGLRTAHTLTSEYSSRMYEAAICTELKRINPKYPRPADYTPPP